MKAASPACFRTAAASALPPSRTYSRGVAKSNPRSTNSLSRALTTAVFSVAPSRMPSTVLVPSQPIPRAAIICRSLKGVPSINPAHKRNSQRTLHQLLHFLPAGLDEILTHRRLLNPVGVVEVLHHRTVVARRKPAHHLVPYSGLQWTAALEQFVAA